LIQIHCYCYEPKICNIKRYDSPIPAANGSDGILIENCEDDITCDPAMFEAKEEPGACGV